MKYIYTISDPETNLVFYVGSSVNVERRANFHMLKNNLTTCLFRIQDIVKKGLRPLFTIVDTADDDWREVERKWILKYKKEGHPILNKQIKGHNYKDYGYDLINNLKKQD